MNLLIVTRHCAVEGCDNGIRVQKDGKWYCWKHRPLRQESPSLGGRGK